MPEKVLDRLWLHRLNDAAVAAQDFRMALAKELLRNKFALSVPSESVIEVRETMLHPRIDHGPKSTIRQDLAHVPSRSMLLFVSRRW